MSNDAPDAAAYYFHYKLTVYDNLFGGIVYGIYIVLYATSVHTFLSKPGFTSSRPRMLMFGITTFMFVLAFITLVLETSLGFQQMGLFMDPMAGNMEQDMESMESSNLATKVIVPTFSRLMFIISDIICAWRAVVFWNRDKRVVAILLLSILVTIVAAGCDLGFNRVLIFSPPHYGIQNERDVDLAIFAVPTLVTNLLSTGLISWKFWKRRILVRKHLSEGSASGSVRADRLFAMLIESGSVYCCLWIFYLISAFGVLPQPGFSVMGTGLLFVAGLYPTFIIILVGMQMSPVEYHSIHSTGMQDTRDPALVPPSMPQHVYRIRREYVSDSDTQVPSAVFMEMSDEIKSLSGG